MDDDVVFAREIVFRHENNAYQIPVAVLAIGCLKQSRTAYLFVAMCLEVSAL